MYDIRTKTESIGEYIIDAHIEIRCLNDFLEVRSLIYRLLDEYTIKGGDVCNVQL